MGSGGLRRALLRRGALLAALAGIAVATIGVPPERPQPLGPRPPVSYPIAAEAENERTHSSANFSITWIHDPATRKGGGLRDSDRDGVPDPVQEILSAFEAARSFVLGDLGYRPPPVNGPLRIYFARSGGTATARHAPGGTGLSRPSFIVLPLSTLRPFSTPRYLRVLAVHEYFHAIQYGYDALFEHWIGEATATWVESVFDETYGSEFEALKAFVSRPRASLNDSSGDHEYGAYLFIQFLVERYGRGNPNVVRELWEQMAVPEAGGPGLGAMDAVRTVVERRGASLPQAWAEFQLWRWDLDRFEEGAAYRKVVGAQWPRALQSMEVVTESCRLSADAGTGLPPLSGDYAVFRPTNRPATAKATVSVEGPTGAVAFVLVEKEDGVQKVKYLTLDGEVQGLASTGVQFGDDQVKRVVLGIANPATLGRPASFAYSLRVDGRPSVAAEALTPPEATDYFNALSLRGQVLCDGKPVPDANVELIQTTRSGEERVFPAITGPDGVWERSIEPEQTSRYEVRVVDPLLSPSTSPPWEVGVRVDLSVDVPDGEVARGHAAEVVGHMVPAHPEAVIRIDYRRPDAIWRSGPQVQPNAAGDYRASVLLPDVGIWQVRATVLSTGDNDHLPFTTIEEEFVSVVNA